MMLYKLFYLRFLYGPFLKLFIDFVTIFLFYVLVFRLRGIWDLSSLTRHRTHTPCMGKQSRNHWATREVTYFFFLINRLLQSLVIFFSFHILRSISTFSCMRTEILSVSSATLHQSPEQCLEHSKH